MIGTPVAFVSQCTAGSGGCPFCSRQFKRAVLRPSGCVEILQKYQSKAHTRGGVPAKICIPARESSRRCRNALQPMPPPRVSFFARVDEAGSYLLIAAGHRTAGSRGDEAISRERCRVGFRVKPFPTNTFQRVDPGPCGIPADGGCIRPPPRPNSVVASCCALSRSSHSRAFFNG